MAEWLEMGNRDQNGQKMARKATKAGRSKTGQEGQKRYALKGGAAYLNFSIVGIDGTLQTYLGVKRFER